MKSKRAKGDSEFVINGVWSGEGEFAPWPPKKLPSSPVSPSSPLPIDSRGLGVNGAL